MSNDSCLFVVVFAAIVDLGMKNEKASGLAVDLGVSGIVPIGQLTVQFVANKCATFAAKPKVFMFFDPDTRTGEHKKVN
jgi:hypothetical protein